MEPPILIYHNPRLEKYEYSGEYQRHCEHCWEDIEEGDLVWIIPFTLRDFQSSEVWHPECFKEANEHEL